MIAIRRHQAGQLQDVEESLRTLEARLTDQAQEAEQKEEEVNKRSSHCRILPANLYWHYENLDRMQWCFGFGEYDRMQWCFGFGEYDLGQKAPRLHGLVLQLHKVLRPQHQSAMQDADMF